jgi:hypothetical protein
MMRGASEPHDGAQGRPDIHFHKNVNAMDRAGMNRMVRRN